MKFVLLAGAALALGTSAAFAADDHAEMSPEAKEFKAACEAAVAATPDSMTDCGCLTKKAVADEATMAELMAYESMETAGENAKAAIMACQKTEEM